MPDTNYTKEEAENLRRAAQDITLFLRIAAVRVKDENLCHDFRRKDGLTVLDWLRRLADRYGNGEDIMT